MAVITLTSASGSPGVTTTALGWALSRGRPTVLVDADPTGGASMLAGYLRGQMVPPDALLELWTAQQQGRLRAALPSLTMSLPDSQVGLLPGTRSHGQARGLVGLWEPLLAALKALEGTGQDVLVDVGGTGLVDIDRVLGASGLDHHHRDVAVVEHAPGDDHLERGVGALFVGRVDDPLAVAGPGEPDGADRAVEGNVGQTQRS